MFGKKAKENEERLEYRINSLNSNVTELMRQVNDIPKTHGLQSNTLLYRDLQTQISFQTNIINMLLNHLNIEIVEEPAKIIIRKKKCGK